MKASNSKVFVSIPNYAEFYCINCDLDIKQVKNPIYRTHFHAPTLICRQIIQRVAQVIAAPVSNLMTNFIIVTTPEFFKSGLLHHILKRLNVTFESNPKPATRSQFEKCMRCTMTLKMTPSWNLAGNYFIKGHDFLQKPRNLQGLLINSSINSQHMILELKSVDLQIRLLSSIDREFLPEEWVHVLPSMKRAQIISVSKRIPETSALKNYEEFRKHWNKMYGYVLPKTADGIKWYTVNFPYVSDTQFDYPDICLCERPPISTPHNSTQAPSAAFVEDFEKAVGFVCEKRVKIVANNPYFSPAIKRSAEMMLKTEFDNKRLPEKKEPGLKKENPLIIGLPSFVSGTPLLKKVAHELPLGNMPKSIEKKFTYSSVPQRLITDFFPEKKPLQSNTYWQSRQNLKEKVAGPSQLKKDMKENNVQDQFVHFK